MIRIHIDNQTFTYNTAEECKADIESRYADVRAYSFLIEELIHGEWTTPSTIIQWS